MAKIRTDIKICTERAIRFWAQVDSSGGSNACWLWLGNTYLVNHKCIKRRGISGALGPKMNASRVAWILHHKKLPKQNVLHCCPNGSDGNCCNPKHLYDSSHAQNMVDCVREGRMVGQGVFGARNGSHRYPERRQGERSGKAKFDNLDIIAIRKTYATGRFTYSHIAAVYKVSGAEISNIVRRKVWRHLP